MSILNDHRIERDVVIQPFEPAMKRPGAISYGVTSYGYDMRVGTKFRIFKQPRPDAMFNRVIDPKAFDEQLAHEFDATDAGYIDLPPHSFALCESVEYFEIPRDVLCICLGKSTYARCGLIVNITPLEPQWRGKVTIELTNSTPLPLRVYADEGIAQVVFLKADQVCKQSYAEKSGKYQDQAGLVLPKVD